MSRNIYRRSNLSGTTSSDLVRDPINTIAELRAYPITDTLDKTLIYVKAESGVFAYHYDSVLADDGSEVIEPNSSSGRWIKVIGGDSYTDEEARDAIASALVAGSNVTITVDDAADTITISSTDTNTNQLTTWTLTDGSNSSTIAHNDTVEFTGAGGITVTESSGIVTITGSPFTDEQVRDAIGTALVAGSNVSIVVDDAGDTITISATDTNTNQLTTWDLTDGSTTTTIAHGDSVTFSGSGGVVVSEASGTITIDGSGVAGSGDNLGNHTATQDLVMGANYITGSKLRFKDSTAAGTTGDYFFYGKYSSSLNPSSMPAKLILYADDGNTASGRGEYIALQPPDAGQLNGSYEIKFPSGQPAANKILKVSQMQGTIAVMSWEDDCCDALTIGAEPPPSGDGSISWNSTTSVLTYTPPDLSGFAVSSSLAAVASTGSYTDLSNTPAIPTATSDLTNDSGFITGVTVGTGLDVTGTSSLTVSLDLSEFTEITNTTTLVSTDQVIVLDNGVERKIDFANINLGLFNNNVGFTANTGDITAVNVGTGLSGGGTSGNVTVSYAPPEHLIIDFGSAFGAGSGNGMEADTLAGVHSKWIDGAAVDNTTSWPVIFNNQQLTGPEPMEYIIELQRGVEEGASYMFLVADYTDVNGDRFAFQEGQKITMHNFSPSGHIGIMADLLHSAVGGTVLTHSVSNIVVGPVNSTALGVTLAAGRGLTILYTGGKFRVVQMY